MKKKQAKKKNISKNGKSWRGFFSYRITFLLLGCVLLLITGAFQLNKKLSSAPCANSISCIDDLTGKVSDNTDGIFLGKKVKAPDAKYFAQNSIPKNSPVLGATSGGSKHIYVDLSAQRLYAFDGNTLVYNFPVSTGKWGPTPTGTFRIWTKLQATRMTGGEGADYYDLPNVPWTMFFSNDQVSRSAGFSIHGAYWHNNFGHVMSHGCVNVRPDNAKLLFDWANPATQGYTTYATTDNPGTVVTIYGSPPADEIAY